MKKFLFVLLAFSLVFAGCKKKGCMDSNALNFDSKAKQDDGSCEFAYIPAIGDSYQGGIIFYLDGNGGGLIAAPTDHSTIVEWGSAVDICANLTLDGYSDWFLPSKDELNLMWNNLADSDGDGYNSGSSDPNNLGGFAIDIFYWSSTEFDISDVWIQGFTSGGQSTNWKSGSNGYVRAVRAF